MQGNVVSFIQMPWDDIARDGAGHEKMFEGSILELTTEQSPGQSTG